ncbi:oxygen-independent coproporphyrinogen III oxidase [Microbaculum marinisediminis]|uniref:Coproporphyrinogen-III oxidase n=1 Tax=Microbaculum marinisediminis TaxID=2931392 RepID=A0AAW5QSL1_9HYPH|nr:oxygen-independent coproporphyrinogen III oxidase [Microbaculum sp. A6E488]MCT8970653.1 oxygen-independent coproporphyrinogen III oxidase [Microbaculum sp. A6E488]
MDPHLIHYATRNVPRYTSYPTAPHFTDPVDAQGYDDWLAALPAEARVSVYLHVPYCRSMCHYCGCHTKAVRRPEPVAEYAETLKREIALAADRLDGQRRLVHLHWGGGTPSLLDPNDFQALADLVRSRFDVAADAEHAIELDPRTVTPELVASLARAGVNRASLGVQDFNPTVQAAIGRVQSHRRVVEVVEALTRAGIGAINMDLMYGLPHQTAREVERTADLAAALAPARIALFGYAHVPWMKTHQRLIDAAALPGAVARIEQAEAAAARLVAHGYVPVGIDHFARPDDPLAIAARTGTLRRNFQGYTTDPADALIGFGASSIGKLPQGYVQNAPDVGGWRRAIEAGRLPIARGKVLSAQDRARAEIIERLMCDFAVDAEAVFARHGLGAETLADAYATLEPLIGDGIAVRDGARIAVPDDRHMFVRLVASAFDAYLPHGAARHSVAV